MGLTEKEYEDCVTRCIHEFLVFSTDYYMEHLEKVFSGCRKWCRKKFPPTLPTEPPKPSGPISIDIPKPGKGCSGSCISISGSTLTALTIDEVKFSGPDCTWVLHRATYAIIKKELTKMLGAGLTSDTCSNDCSCQNKQVFDGKTVSVTFGGEKIQLDPLNFDKHLAGGLVALRPTGPNCFIELKGKATISVGKGWVGTCEKDADSRCP